MVKVKESVSRQELMDMIDDYALRNDHSSLQEFVDYMHMRLRVEEAIEYAIQRSMIDGRTCHPFIGKIANGYIQDFRHSWPFQDGGEFYSKLP
jgi:hypothetical protein